MNENLLEKADLSSGEFRISYQSIRAYRRGLPLNLRPKELQLLELFIKHRGQILTREYLANSIYIDDFVDIRTIDVHVMRLRKGLRHRNWKDPIKTVRSGGYRLI